jgi:peptidylprolyl isomerase
MGFRGTREYVLGAYLFIAIICLLATIGGCGGGDSSDTAAAETGIPDSQPKLEPPPGLPPNKLVAKDLIKGTGAEAKKGDKVALQYYCIIWGTGAEYANSWRYPSPPTFVLGEKLRLQPGLNLAVPGMKEGGGREVQVPAKLLFYPGTNHAPARRLEALLCKVYLVEVLGK